MTTTRQHLEAMKKADLKRALMGQSSMHHSWLDDESLAAAMRDLETATPWTSHEAWLAEMCAKYPDLHCPKAPSEATDSQSAPTDNSEKSSIEATLAKPTSRA